MTKPSLQDKFRGAFIGSAIGDSLGYPIELANSPEEIKTIAGEDGVIDLPNPALISDDTQFCLCVAQALLNNKDSLNSESFMQHFAAALISWQKSQTDPEKVRNPDLTTATAAERLALGIGWQQSGLNGFGNGPAVRTMPIGLRFKDDITTIIDMALSSSRVTHQDSGAECGAVANALISCCALLDVPTGVWGNEVLIPVSGIDKTFEETIQKATELSTSNLPPYLVMSEAYIGQGWDGADLIGCALYCCMKEPNDFKSAVLTAVNSKGDSDSIGCVVGGWMGAKLGIQAIPQDWVDRIEGKAQLLQFADALLEASTRQD